MINIVRDCRWGRTVETFGEDVLLSSNMGYEMCKGLEKNGVIATPKHFVDNYGEGGRDSNYSNNSERTLREVYLKPFEKCFRAGVAHSVMPAYTAWDGVPCSANKKLLTKILRDEWGFDGFAVSDYRGVDGVYKAHRLTDTYPKAHAMCIKAGLELNLPSSSIENLRAAYKEGYLTDEDIDKAVFNILKNKFAFGLFDHPYADPEKAQALVRCEKHKKLALKAARESIILLKNDGLLPLDKKKIRKIAVFGDSANVLPVGRNYSGSYKALWTAEDAVTPFEYLKSHLGDDAEVIYASDRDIDRVAPVCDACIYFTTIVEGEGLDRCNIDLPKVSHTAEQADGHAYIVGKIKYEIRADQDTSIRKLIQANPNTVIMMLNGAPVDMSAWIEDARAVVEAWYPGEQGAQAMAELVFGEYSPSAKLPITIPRCVGQLPLYYCYKPSGRRYSYNDNDGTPLYAFGHGLSYTAFEISDVKATPAGSKLDIAFSLANTGMMDGAEVVQIYLSGKNCDVVMPLKELKGYKRVEVGKGEKERVSVTLDREAFSYYDQCLDFGMHDGDYTVLIGTSSDNIAHTFEVKVRGGAVLMV